MLRLENEIKMKLLLVEKNVIVVNSVLTLTVSLFLFITLLLQNVNSLQKLFSNQLNIPQ